MRLTIAIAVVLASGCTHAPASMQRDGVVSVDYCADQMVLGLLPRAKIKAVSVEAASDQSFAGPRAAGIARVRPQLESILALRPAVVVRSYGGAPQLDRQLARLGIRVVQLGYAGTLADGRAEVERIGSELDADAKAKQLLARFDRQLANRPPELSGAKALYITPGDVTTGPGSFVADVMAAAGFQPYRTKAGWGSLPLEDMVRRPPDVVFRAFFDSQRYQQDFWAASRHPVAVRAAQQAVDIEVPGAWLACGNWLAGDAVAKLRAAPVRI